MKLNKFIFIILSNCTTLSIVNAATMPSPSILDDRVQVVLYNENDVVIVKTRVGVSTLIKLADDEQLTNSPFSGMGVGDSEAWNISVRGNNIFIKPIAASPDTNITIVSNKRTYLISLETAQKGTAPAFLVKYKYPEVKKINIVKKGSSTPCMNGDINYNYMKWGDGSLSPTSAWDDGRFTCFKYPTSTDLPAVYKKMPDGSEALVNSHLENDILVVHDVSSEYRFRLGGSVLGVKSDTVNPAGFNYKGTTTNNIREVINNEQ